jgi:signal transduction histidine kinase
MQLDLPTEKLYALVDPHQLENALLNLAINARDAMPDGGHLGIGVARRHVSASLALLVEVPAGDYVQFDVSDSGGGIAPELLPRVFEPFFTTKASAPAAAWGCRWCMASSASRAATSASSAPRARAPTCASSCR